MASLFTLMTLTVTKANAKETFIYGETDNGLIVSTLNEDGKTLTPNGNTSTSTTNKDD